MAPFAQKRMLAHLKPDPSRPFGRPSEYRPEYCEMVIEAMSQGLSLTAFAGMIRKSREVVYSWMSAHRDFADAVSRARSTRTLWLEQKLLRSRKGAETTAAIFALRNAQPDEWRDVRSVEHQHVHEIKQLTDAELNRIAAGHVPPVGDETVIDGTCERVDPQHGNEH
jgi:hypothetical protein